MRPHSFILGLTLCLAASCGRKSSTPGLFAIISDPPNTISHQDQLFFQFDAVGEGSDAVYELIEGPPGLTIDEVGLLHWRPAYSDLGVHPIRFEARSGNRTIQFSFDLRVSQGFNMGVTDSPRDHSTGATEADRTELFIDHDTHGRMIAFDGDWRDDITADGETPQFVQDALLAAQVYDFHPSIGLSWSDATGAPDLTSESDPTNNSWSNAETRSEFLEVVERIATDVQPLYFYLGHETNLYYLTHTQAEWNEWLVTLEAAYAIVHAVSPDTILYTVFQLERMKGLGGRAGHADAAHFNLVDELEAGGYVDAIGFTSYPFLEYATPDQLPLAYYDEISLHTGKQVIFSEIAWPAETAGVFTGSDTDQMMFLQTFFDRVQDVPVEYAVWLYLHDGSKVVSGTALSKLGMRSSDGVEIRPVDTMWRDAVVLRQR